MKISFEFTSIRDMLHQMPKFAQLVAGEGTSEERMAIALEDDPTPLILKITPKDGIAFTEEQKEAIKATIRKFTDEATVETAERIRAEILGQTATESAESADPEAPEEKPKKNPPKAKKAEEPAQEKAEEAPAEKKADAGSVSETEARKALNGLVKARTNAAVKLVFHELGVKNFNDLEDDQYAEAAALAEKVGNMTDEEYEAALKEAGIKGGKK